MKLYLVLSRREIARLKKAATRNARAAGRHKTRDGNLNHCVVLDMETSETEPGQITSTSFNLAINELDVQSAKHEKFQGIV